MTDPCYVINTVTNRTGSTVRLYLRGQFDRTASRALGRALWEVLHPGRPVSVIIDVGEVEVLSSECVDDLLVGYVRALRSGHGFQVTKGQGLVRQILLATNLCARLDDDVLYPPAWTDELVLAVSAGANRAS